MGFGKKVLYHWMKYLDSVRLRVPCGATLELMVDWLRIPHGLRSRVRYVCHDLA